MFEQIKMFIDSRQVFSFSFGEIILSYFPFKILK